MAATKRIYVVKYEEDGNEPSTRLVEATSQARALSFVIKDTMTVELASQSELVALITKGVSVEVAGE